MIHEKDSGGQVFDADVALKAVRAEVDQLDLISRSGRPGASSATETPDSNDTDELPVPEVVADDPVDDAVEHEVLETVDDPRIPEGQAFFKIGEVSEIVGVKPYVLRYWENEFSWVKPEKTSSRQRRYRRQDVALLLQIRRLRYDEQLPVARARALIRESRRRGAPKSRPTSLHAGNAPLLVHPINPIDGAARRRELQEMRRIVQGLLSAVED